MTEEDRVVQALRSAATEAQRSSPPTDETWRQIQRRAARRHRRRWLGRLAAILAPLLAAGGIATGAIESYAPASHPRQVIVPPPPPTTVVVTTTLPVSTTVPVSTTQPTATTRPPSRSATVAPPTSTTPTTIYSAALTSVPWASITYPFGCGTTLQGPVGYRVVHVAYPEPAPGRKVAVVMVECHSGAGTPPVELLVYDAAPGTLAPHLSQTLIQVSSRYQASAFTASGATLTLGVNGFLLAVGAELLSGRPYHPELALDRQWLPVRYLAHVFLVGADQAGMAGCDPTAASSASAPPTSTVPPAT